MFEVLKTREHCFPPERRRIAGPRSRVFAGRVDIPIGALGSEHGSGKETLHSGHKLVFGFLFDLYNRGTVAHDQGKEGFDDKFDLDFTGEQDRVVSRKGVRAEASFHQHLWLGGKGYQKMSRELKAYRMAKLGKLCT